MIVVACPQFPLRLCSRRINNAFLGRAYQEAESHYKESNNV